MSTVEVGSFEEVASQEAFSAPVAPETETRLEGMTDLEVGERFARLVEVLQAGPAVDPGEIRCKVNGDGDGSGWRF